MSQYPPGGPPGYGYAGQAGFGQEGYSLPSMTRTSGAAIASFVCGLVMCVPGITGLVAVITGIIGIVQTGKPEVRGRGLAVAGLILGMISLAGWGLLGVGGYALFQSAKPQRTFARTFIADLAARKVAQCVQNSTVNLPAVRLDGESKKMQAWGPLLDTTIIAFRFVNNNGVYAGTVHGICRFPSAQHSFVIQLVKDSTGQFKADSLIWEN